MSDGPATHDIYQTRFDEREERTKDALWREIVRYLAPSIDPTAPLLDIGCDRGHFIRWATASERWASDIRDVREWLPADVRFVHASGLDLAGIVPNDHFGTIFMSNYLEHLPSSDAVVEQLLVAFRLLRPGGRLIVLQPNIRLVGTAYWDYIDHRVALTERSLLEAASLAGFLTARLVTKFLPYTVQGRLPADPRLVRAYLAIPLAWRFLGKQSLYIGRRPGG